MTHDDEWIDDRKNDAYATWVFSYFRLPAIDHERWWPFMQHHPLFCTHEGKRYRVTGASRLGDAWLAKSITQDTRYNLRVDVALCSEWAATPEVRTVERPEAER